MTLDPALKQLKSNNVTTVPPHTTHHSAPTTHGQNKEQVAQSKQHGATNCKRKRKQSTVRRTNNCSGVALLKWSRKAFVLANN